MEPWFFFFEDLFFRLGDPVISAGEPETLNVRAANLIYILWLGLVHYYQRE